MKLQCAVEVQRNATMSHKLKLRLSCVLEHNRLTVFSENNADLQIVVSKNF